MLAFCNILHYLQEDEADIGLAEPRQADEVFAGQK